LKLIHLGSGLHVRAEIVRDDEAPVEARKAIQCSG
jgi:hypothetical protein